MFFRRNKKYMGHRDTKQVLRRNKMELKDFTINNIIELVCTQPVEKTTEGNNLFQILNENTAYNVDVLFQKTSEDKDCLAILAVYYSEKKEKIKISIQTETIGNAKEALVAWFYNNINDYTNTMEELKKELEKFKDINFFAIFRKGETKKDVIYEMTLLDDIEYGHNEDVVNVNTNDYTPEEFLVDKRALLVLIAPLFELDKEIKFCFMSNQIIDLMKKYNMSKKEASKEVKMQMLNRLIHADVIYLLNDFCVKKMVETSI